MRFTRNAGTVLIAATLLLGACGGDSNDPTTFDPAGMSDDFDAASGVFQANFTGEVGANFDLVADRLATMTGGVAITASANTLRSVVSDHRSSEARDSFTVAAKNLLRSRTAVSGSAVILPPELEGNTYVWDVGGSDYVLSDRTDAPDDGVRFVLYALDPVTDEPAAPLNEVGYLDLRDLSTASTDAARIVLVSQSVTWFDYQVAASGDESDGNVNVIGFVGSGNTRINFDLRNQFTSTVGSDRLDVDWELEFPVVDLSLTYDIGFVDNAAGSSGEWSASLRGPNGYVDMTGLTADGDGTFSEEFAFEVNGEEFAVYSCATGDEVCAFTNPAGEPLTAAEAESLDRFWGFAEGGALISAFLMHPAGLFLF